MFNTGGVDPILSKDCARFMSRLRKKQSQPDAKKIAKRKASSKARKRNRKP